MMDIKTLAATATITFVYFGANAEEDGKWKTFYVVDAKRYCSEAEIKSDNKNKTIHKQSPAYCDILEFNEPVEWNGTGDPPRSDITVRARGKTYVMTGDNVRRHRLFSGSERDFLTSKIGLICMSPFQLTEAASAVSDPKWLQSLGCLTVPAGVPATLIEPQPPITGKPWKVRLNLPNGSGATVWGHSFAFTWPDGTAAVP